MPLVRQSLALLRGLRDEGHESIIVGVSGGKDSLATLSLCTQVFPVVHGYFLYVVPGLECEERYLRIAEKRFGIDLIRLPSPPAASYLRFSALRKLNAVYHKKLSKNLRYTDIEAILRSRCNSHWIAGGQRITDSLQRRGMILRHKGVWREFGRCYPIWDWKPRDVLSYLRSQKIPIPGMFGTQVTGTSGVALSDTRSLVWIRDNFPQDFEKICRVFPGCRDMIFRDELRVQHGIKEAVTKKIEEDAEFDMGDAASEAG